MARRARPPVFVGRQSYRLRRWRDAARLLPVLGLTLWLIPLLWPTDETSNSAIVIYVFVVWAGLVVAARAIAPRALGDPAAAGDDAADGPD